MVKDMCCIENRTRVLFFSTIASTGTFTMHSVTVIRTLSLYGGGNSLEAFSSGGENCSTTIPHHKIHKYR